MIFAFDPGVNTGWAILWDAPGVTSPHRRLLSCGLSEWEGFVVKKTSFSSEGAKSILLAIERPQVYSARLQKGDQADIVDTAIRAGIIAGEVRSRVYVHKAIFPTPREWKGQVDKDVHNKRVLASLSTEERALIPKLPKTKLHNVIDACGLALWAAGRL